MPAYYRAIFTINTPNDTTTGLPLLRQATAAIRQWATPEAGAKLDAQPSAWQTHARELDESGYFNLIHEPPPPPDPDAPAPRLSIRLATRGQELEADLEARDHDNTPSPNPAEAVAVLCQDFQCQIGEHNLRLEAERHQTDATLIHAIHSPHRLIPLILISTEQAETHPLDPDHLQRQLLGLAQVTVLDHPTAWQFSSQMPRPLRCYDGAIRLYAPGCSENDVPQQHPYWLPDDAAKLGTHRFAQLLQDQCINRQPHHPRRRMFTEARDYIDRRYVEDLEQKLQQSEQQGTDPWEELQFIFETLLEEEPLDANVKRVATVFARRNKKLVEEKRQLEEEVARLRQTTRPAPNRQPAAAGNPPPASIPEAVNQAQTLPGLRFLPNATETANSPYTRQFDRNADTFHRAFQALSQCAAARAQGPLGMPTADWLKQRGVEYAPGESEATMHRNRGRLADERAFHDPKTDQHIPMPAHLKLLGTQIRIHLSWSDPDSAWLIGYIGEHLPTASDPH